MHRKQLRNVAVWIPLNREISSLSLKFLFVANLHMCACHDVCAKEKEEEITGRGKRDDMGEKERMVLCTSAFPPEENSRTRAFLVPVARPWAEYNFKWNRSKPLGLFLIFLIIHERYRTICKIRSINVSLNTDDSEKIFKIFKLCYSRYLTIICILNYISR